MLKTTKVQREVLQVTGFVCDKCGKEIDPNDSLEFQEVQHLEGSPGYSSKFGDSCPWEVDFCDTCWFELVGKYVRYV